MEVILLQDVKKVGKKGQLVKVSDGYAMNLLLPRKLAVIATEKAQEVKKDQDKHAQEEFEANKQKALELKEQLKSISVVLYAKAGKDGKMFGSISSKEVTEELKKQHGLDIDKRKFLGETLVKNIGTTVLKNELFKGVVADIKVEVKEK